MSCDLLKKLEEFTTIGKKVRFYDKRSPRRYYEVGEVVDEVSVIQREDPEYKYFIQKIRTSKGKTEYRICYYTLSADNKRIIFGQFASNMGENDFRELMIKVREKEWF